MVSPERLDSMQQRFVQLMERYHITPVAAYPVFDWLVQAYSEPQRHYHDLEHLAEMFKVVGRLADMATDLPAINLAVWFHDAVYDPQARDNEARSAAALRTHLEPLGVPAATLAHVDALIMATTHSAMVPADPDTIVLLDADLAILAAEPKRYQRYAAAIRQEYAWVPEPAYRAGRIQVLTQFLARPRVYLSERMFAVGEEAARANLAGEITALQRDPLLGETQ